MITRNWFLLVLCIGLVHAADRRAKVSASSISPSVQLPIIGYFQSPGGLVVIEGIPGAAHTRLVRPGEPQGASAGKTAPLRAASDGTWNHVMPGPVSAIAFLPGGTDAIVAVNDIIYLLKGSVPIPVLQDAGGAQALLASDDGRSAIILNRDGREALILDLQTSATKHLTIGTAARDIQRGRDGTVIFVPQQGRSPWLLDMKSQALSFAPALPEEVTQ